MRSASGDRDAVVLGGSYGTEDLVSILASDVTVADVTLRRAYNHPIHVSGTPGAPISGVLIHHVRIADPGQQAIKVNPVGDGYADDGVVECSLIELAAAGRAEIRDFWSPAATSSSPPRRPPPSTSERVAATLRTYSDRTRSQLMARAVQRPMSSRKRRCPSQASAIKQRANASWRGGE